MIAKHIFIISLAYLVVQAEDIQVTPIPSQILPFHLGKGKIIESKHTFIHYVELAPLVKLLDNTITYYNIINNTLSNYTTFSSRVTYRNILNNLLTHAHFLIKQADNKLKNLAPHIRTKRGLIDFVGKTSKFLFGTLDSEDATNFEKAIDTLSRNQKSINEQMQMQISLTQHLIDHYNHTITTLNNNKKLIELRLNYFEHNLIKSFDNISSFLRAQNTLDQIILNSQNLITLLDNLENAVTFAKLNTVHNSIISVSDIKHILNTLTNLYKIDKIPFFQNILSYYQLIDLRASFIKDKIIFAIIMPIFNSDNFDYYHLYPIPQNNLTIIPEQPFLMLSSLNHQYEDEPCGAIEDLYICPDKLNPNGEDCVISLILNVKKKKCSLTPIHTPHTITKRLSHNCVLVIPGTTISKLEKSCESNGYFIIEKPSVIKIPHHCKIKNKESTYINEENSILGEPFILPEVRTEEVENHPTIEHLNLRHIDLDDISQLKKEASSIHTPRIVEYHQSHPVYISILVVLTLAVCCLLLWKLKNRCYKKTTNSTPENPSPEEKIENKPILFSNLRREELDI
jgi:hypothetical protein